MPGKKLPTRATKTRETPSPKRVVAKPDAPPTATSVFDDQQIRRLELLVPARVGADNLPVAQPRLELVLSPLRWLNDLLPDSHRTLAGDVDAATRLRINLTALGDTARRYARAAATGSSSIDASNGVSTQESNWTPLPQRRTQTNPQALAQLASAAVWAANDEAEAQLMLDGLATAVAASQRAHELLCAVDAGDPNGASVRSMTLGPDGFGGLGGFNPNPTGVDGGLDPLGTPTVPKVPKTSDGTLIDITGGIGSLIPSKWWQDIVRDPETPGGLRFRNPVYVEPCILRAIAAMSKLRNNSPHWQITAISDPTACPGSTIILTGTGFGTKKGEVTFAAAQNDRTNGTVTSWSDTTIKTRIPDDAIPGGIQVLALAGTVRMCGGGAFPVMRSGTSLVEFRGGRPEISYFDLRYGAVHRVDFSTAITIDLVTTSGADLLCGIAVYHGPTLITKLDNLPGGAHTLSFQTPQGPTPMALRCRAHASNSCGTAESEFFLIVGPKPIPIIENVSFVQGIQYPTIPTSRTHDPLTVIDKRPTLARVYVHSPFTTGFDFGTNPGELSVNGRMRLTSSVGAVTITPNNAPFPAQPTSTLDAALDFELPQDHLVGSVTVIVEVWPTSIPDDTGHWSISSSATTTFAPSGHLTFVQLLYRDDVAPHTAAAPSAADWNRGILSIAERFPISPGQLFQIPSVSLLAMGTGTNNLRNDRGWEDCLDEIYDIADDHDWAEDSDVIWLGMTPTNVPTYSLSGISMHDGIRCVLVQGTLQASIAHEVAHTLRVDHAPAANPGRALPDDIDSRLPSDGQIESGTVGWRPSDGRIFTSPWSELMSYQTPSSGLYQDRWPSAALWNILIDEIG